MPVNGVRMAARPRLARSRVRLPRGHRSSFDRVLLFTLAPLFLLCVVLPLRHPNLLVPIDVVGAATAEDYPVFLGRAWVGGEWGDLLPGDRLLRVGGEDLRGVSRIGFYALLMERASEGSTLSVILERAGEISGSLPLLAAPFPWVGRLTLVAIAATAVVLLLRAPRLTQVQAFFPAAMALCISSTQPPCGPRWETYYWLAKSVGASVLLVPSSLRFALVFPQETSARTWLTRGWSWALGLLLGLVLACWWLDAPLPRQWVGVAIVAFPAALLFAFLAILTWNYRRADPIGRRQAKWVLLGLYVGVAPIAVAFSMFPIHQFDMYSSSLLLLTSLAWLAVPAGFLIAVLRFDLFDIDRLISSTASYSILGVLVLAGAFALVPRLAEAASTAAGVDPSSAQLVLSVALAAVAIPAHRALRPRIDRVLFPERHALEEGMQQLLGEIAGERDARRLTTLVGERLDALLRPESCVVYAGGEAGYGPIFTRGRGVPPAFESRSPSPHWRSDRVRSCRSGSGAGAGVASSPSSTGRPWTRSVWR